jgi:hypothetical protein
MGHMKHMRLLPKVLFVGFCYTGLYTSSVSDIARDNITLERLDFARIQLQQGKIEQRQSKITNRRRAVWIAGGLATAAGGAYISYHLLKATEKPEQETLSEAEQEKIKQHLNTETRELLAEERRLRQEHYTFAGIMKDGLRNGAVLGIAGFCATFFALTNESVKNKLKSWWGPSESFLYAHSVASVAKRLQELHEVLRDLEYQLYGQSLDQQKDFHRFKHYFCHDVVLAHTSLMYALESMIALVANQVAQKSGEHPELASALKKELNQLDESVAVLTDYLEIDMNVEQAASERIQVQLLFKHMYACIMRFVNEWGMTLHGEDFENV